VNFPADQWGKKSVSLKEKRTVKGKGAEGGGQKKILFKNTTLAKLVFEFFDGGSGGNEGVADQNQKQKRGDGG